MVRMTYRAGLKIMKQTDQMATSLIDGQGLLNNLYKHQRRYRFNQLFF